MVTEPGNFFCSAQNLPVVFVFSQRLQKNLGQTHFTVNNRAGWNPESRFHLGKSGN